MNDGVPSGVALLDKPRGITSHDAVARLRRALGTRKVGHAGTLDPMATGLLILGVGTATRLLTHLVGLDKTYVATIRLGATTTSDDAEGETLRVADASGVTDSAIAAGVAGLTGDILQRPSAVSAIKVDGVRAYQRVRAGEEVELAARPVTIRAFDVLERRGAALDVRVECSSGTYVRALARDLGEALGVGGHLTALRRTAVGPFRVEDAVPVPERATPRPGDDEDGPVPAAEPPLLLDPAEVAARLFPVARLAEDEAVDLANGKRLALALPDAAAVAAVAPDGRLVGLVEVRSGRTRVLTNFPVER